MKKRFLAQHFRGKPGRIEAPDPAYQLLREELASAGLDEDALRKMDPDDRVAALEQASLDPYDFIYLAC